jgi:hypothetical protein
MEPRAEERKSRFQIEKLEERIAPSCVKGLTTALESPGAEHRSETASERLAANLARCEAREAPPA